MVRGKVHRDALDECFALNKKELANLKEVLQRHVGGRPGPNRDVNHLHIAGAAHFNLLFDNKTFEVLGFVYHHMEKQSTGGAEEESVNNRRGHANQMVEVAIIGGKLFEVVYRV